MKKCSIVCFLLLFIIIYCMLWIKIKWFELNVLCTSVHSTIHWKYACCALWYTYVDRFIRYRFCLDSIFLFRFVCVPLCVCCHQRLMNVIVRHVEVAFQLNALVTNISTCNRQFGVCMCCLFILCNCTLFYTFSLQTDSMKCDAMLFNRRTLYSTNWQQKTTKNQQTANGAKCAHSECHYTCTLYIYINGVVISAEYI